MPRITQQGKVYSTDELINLAKIGQMGNLSGACLSAFEYIKRLEAQIQMMNDNQMPDTTGVVFDISSENVSTEETDKK